MPKRKKNNSRRTINNTIVNITIVNLVQNGNVIGINMGEAKQIIQENLENEKSLLKKQISSPENKIDFLKLLEMSFEPVSAIVSMIHNSIDAQAA